MNKDTYRIVERTKVIREKAIKKEKGKILGTNLIVLSIFLFFLLVFSYIITNAELIRSLLY